MTKKTARTRPTRRIIPDTEVTVTVPMEDMPALEKEPTVEITRENTPTISSDFWALVDSVELDNEYEGELSRQLIEKTAKYLYAITTAMGDTRARSTDPFFYGAAYKLLTTDDPVSLVDRFKNEISRKLRARLYQRNKAQQIKVQVNEVEYKAPVQRVKTRSQLRNEHPTR